MNENELFRSMAIGLPAQIERRRQAGDLRGAVRLIDMRLRDETLTDAERESYTLWHEIIVRTPEDYPFTKEQALALIREHIPDFTEEEFDTRLDNGEILWAFLEGEMRVIDSFFDTLCKADPSFAARAHVMMHGVESLVKEEGEGRLDRIVRLMKENGSVSNRIRIRASIRVKDEAFTPGMKVRVHLPVPKACIQQKDIVIEKMTEGGFTAGEDTPWRTVFWEKTLEENETFFVEYSYTHTAVYHDTENMHGATKEQPAFCTAEQPPHIVFTPAVKAITAEITAGKTDALGKARAIYDFITLNMKYRFMPHYFILGPIPDACLKNRYGDCGIFALTFVTMCRCAGIPAVWQSGLTAEPDYCGSHDWARFYIAPYGWLFADPSYGTGAVRANNEARRKFYFGNLDAYRMVANEGFMEPFVPGKRFFSARPCDNQSGEIETDERGLRGEEITASREVLELKEL